MEDMRQFLEAMETMGPGLLFEEGGKEGLDKIDPAKKAALEGAGMKGIWVYEPEGYDLVVVELNKDGEKKDSWGVVFFTEAEKISGEEPEEDIFGESLREDQESEMKIIQQTKGNFLDTVQLCIELASNKSMKGGFTKAKVATALAAAKKGGSKGAAPKGGKPMGGKPMGGKPPMGGGKPMPKKPAAPAEDEEEEEE